MPDAAPNDAPTLQAPPREAEQARRLHPMTLLQRVLVSLPALLFILAPFLLRSPDENAYVSLFSALAYGVIALPLIALQYLRFSYWITPKEIVIQSGVLKRQHRSIPIERVQNIQTVQSLVPRLFGTAKVKIETAGSSSTEGVLEYVSLEEAERIRQVVRAFQRRQAGSEIAPSTLEAEHAAAETSSEENVLFAMPLGRVLLSGAFRFSLIYIALIFSGLQYIPDFEERAARWFEQGQFRWLADLVTASPYLAAFFTVAVAALLAWLTGVLINLNRYYNFRLWLEDGKLHRRHGLLTLSEGTIPLEKVQALILRTNPLMQRFGWWRLELQTMGLDVEEQGHQVAAPFAQKDEVLQLARHIRPFDLPESFARVSRLTIRRAFVRYAVGLAVLVILAGTVAALAGAADYFWQPALWGFAALPLLLGLAVLQYRRHGYALQEDALYVRRGVLSHYLWVLPTEKQQVFYASASLFQRRLGLKSLHVDTAGAASLAYPEVVDLPAKEADSRLDELYTRFQQFFASRWPVRS